MSFHARARALALVLAGTLAGCVGAPGPSVLLAGREAEPRSAILYRDTVTVRFSDGVMCVALRPGRARAWAGILQGCPYTQSYRVTLPDGPGRPRRVLVATAAGGMTVIAVDNAAFGLTPGV